MELERHLVELPSVDRQLTELGPREQALTQLSEAMATKKEALDKLSERIAKRSVSIAKTERLLQALARWRTASATASNLAPQPEPSDSTESGLPAIWGGVNRMRDQLSQLIQSVTSAEADTRELHVSATEAKLVDETSARSLRKEIEQLQGGAGAVTSAGQQLRERKAQLNSLRELHAARSQHLRSILDRRSEALDRLDQVREERFAARQDTATLLNSALGPRIRLAVRRRGQFEQYASAIADVLKGSGLKYGELSEQVAQRVSPRELVEAAEGGDVGAFAHSAEISTDRAARVLAQVQSANLGELSTVIVEDDVQLQLLDGSVYKDISDLSTGQRCTVVLPIVLRHKDRVLIVDQPEDHIDNAFIADTLIKAIRPRSESEQLLFSTHNANIPVLGDADWVIQLASDGKRGFLVQAAPLHDAEVIEAISSVMEGGAEAFRRRAEFYAGSPLA